MAAFSLHRYHPHLKMSPCNWWEYGYTDAKKKSVDMYSYVQDDQTIEWMSNDAGESPTRPTKRARRTKNLTLKLSREPPATLSRKAASEYLRRSAKLLVHELLHLLLVGHCIYYKCLMNGTGHLVEDFASPSHLCGIDLRKLQFRLGFDIVQRYELLAEIWKDWEFPSEAQWCRKQAERCRGYIETENTHENAGDKYTARQAALLPEIIDIT